MTRFASFLTIASLLSFAPLVTACDPSTAVEADSLASCGNDDAATPDAGGIDAMQVPSVPDAGGIDAMQVPSVPAVAPIDSVTHGKTYREWTEAWWQFAYAIPAAVNPINGGDCTLGQMGDVWFLAGNHGGVETRTCHVPAHTALFFPVINKICKQCPEAGCAASHNTDLDVCSSRGIDMAHDMFLDIDGVAFADVAGQRVKSLPFTWSAPTDPADQVSSCIGQVPANTCGTPEGARFGQTDGYWLMLEPLAPGEHVLHFGGAQTQSNGTEFTLDVTYHLTVE